MCEDFTKCIEEAVTKYSDAIINFYTWPDSYFKTRIGLHFRWNQCTYYPEISITKLVAEMRRLHEQESRIPYDELEVKAIWTLGLVYYEYKPCLVQYIGYQSLISHVNYTDTIYFKDYLDELHIDYSSETEIQNNHAKLRSLLEKTRIANGYIASSRFSNTSKRKLLINK